MAKRRADENGTGINIRAKEATARARAAVIKARDTGQAAHKKHAAELSAAAAAAIAEANRARFVRMMALHMKTAAGAIVKATILCERRKYRVIAEDESTVKNVAEALEDLRDAMKTALGRRRTLPTALQISNTPAPVPVIRKAPEHRAAG